MGVETTDQPDTGATPGDGDNPTPPSSPPADGSKPQPDLDDPGKRALDQERKARRDAEKQLKATQGELEQLRQAQMNDQEKAIAEAVAKAKAGVLAEVGGRLVDAEFKAAAAGRSIDVDVMLEGLDRAKFLTEDGQPDTERITGYVDRLAPKSSAKLAPTARDMGQGARPSDGVTQIRDRAQLTKMSPEEIVKARQEGRLNDLMGITP